MLVYVDDLVIVGDQPHKLFDELAGKVKLKKTGLLTEGVTVKFLGRKLRMLNGIIELYMQENYLEDTFKEHGLENARPVVAPGVSTMQSPDGVSSLDDTKQAYIEKELVSACGLCH